MLVVSAAFAHPELVGRVQCSGSLDSRNQHSNAILSLSVHAWVVAAVTAESRFRVLNIHPSHEGTPTS
ncbi:hypothetical protein [Rhodococcus erythropolis]